MDGADHLIISLSRQVRSQIWWVKID